MIRTGFENFMGFRTINYSIFKNYGRHNYGGRSCMAVQDPWWGLSEVSQLPCNCEVLGWVSAELYPQQRLSLF
jgi:hypothetical protein